MTNLCVFADRTDVVWQVTGDLDIVGARALRSVSTWLPDPGRRLRVDIGDVPFMDCSGLSALIDLSRQARTRDVDVVITGARRQVLRLLTVTETEDLLTVLPADESSVA
ncbi:MAG: STAS domain-containing protein [Actinomycetes bacterium]